MKLQNEAGPDDQLIFSIVGWHAITLPQKAKELSASRWDMLATLLAIGIDPKRSILFHQDDVSRIQNCHAQALSALTEPLPHRTRMDLQLYHPSGQTAADDDLESTPCGLSERQQ